MMLEAAQVFVRDAVCGPEPVAASRAREVVADGLRLPPAEQLEVYREQFFLRHIHSLEEDFACVARLVGPEEFWPLAKAYLLAHPPAHYDLHRLGQAFPGFLAARQPVDLLAVDAARFDWAFMEAFGTLDAPPLRPESFAHAPESAWPGARLVFQPSLRLVRLAFPLDAFRRALKGGGSTARPEPATELVVVSRGADARLCSTVLERGAFELLLALVAGERLGDACDKVAALLGPADAGGLSERVGAWFQSWTADGWVSEVRF